MKKLSILFLFGVLSIACSENGEDCCTIIDTGVSIKYLNTAGENLFQMENGLTESDITIYHKIENEWVEYFEGNLDYPKGIRVVERENETYLLIFLSTTIVENNYSETKIEFAGGGADILKAEIDKSNSNEIVTKVWYNGDLKWEASTTERMFEIRK